MGNLRGYRFNRLRAWEGMLVADGWLQPCLMNFDCRDGQRRRRNARIPLMANSPAAISALASMMPIPRDRMVLHCALAECPLVLTRAIGLFELQAIGTWRHPGQGELLVEILLGDA